MTTDRLDRIESILAAVTESQQRTQQQQEATTMAIATMAERQEQADANLRESINDVVSLIGSLAEQDAADAAEFRQRHTEHEQRFNNLLDDARSDRQRNESEHQAFREVVRSLLGEIRAIWQRLAG